MIEKPTRRPEQATCAHICEPIVSEVAASMGTSPLELPPIYETIEIDALEQLFDGRESSSGQPTGRVEFTYSDHSVEVESTGNVHVSPDQTHVQSEADTDTRHHRSEANTEARHDRSEAALCESIVTAVSARTETDFRDMKTLYNVIDPDALAKLCEGAYQRGSSPEELEVEFYYQGCRVTVRGDGRVRVDHRAG